MLNLEKMDRVIAYLKNKAPKERQLTLGETVEVALNLGVKVSEVVLGEVACYENKKPEEVLHEIKKAFEHNLKAAILGSQYEAQSFLLNKVGADLAQGEAKITEDTFLNQAITFTLAAQVGNHIVGLAPCAGTGDACVFTGVVKALLDHYPEEKVWPAVGVMLKAGVMFRAGKVTTGCNMEGLGAGATGTAAALAEIEGGSPRQVEHAMVLALSPTIAVPCTPRVLVPGLCATHIGGAVLLGYLAARLALATSLPVNVPIDVMLALAAEAHKISATSIVPAVVRYMEPYFKRDPRVDQYLLPETKEIEYKRQQETADFARKQAEELARLASPITRPFGEVVVGGSSQAVGSPTNTARIAHALAKGEIKKVKIELYPELFARRAINVPGILMGAVLGASTANSEAYNRIMDEIIARGIEVVILEVKEPQVQRVTIEATERNAMVHALNRGGGRLALVDAYPSLDEARKMAASLGIEIVP
ncbi:2-hydroxymethylglutarate dehydratase [Thermanaeromonas toyohensis ToBE]|uniref:2-hydroxymethylglutarate dehydratase n=1 Tax=Thermanaeromonas toyohensis ToBE TaxID=698762 RepID=A0A1W1VJ93_9FIRM|nr:L-serine ammonia-lyase, iron-sulfur-dependent, subunit alpha [Thermanaeromonas toyohensis]SMB93398.1 2-hydroxymethylglutarate dehydratase [Thermanaeromonas toyohensis ToBE]